MPKPNEPIWFNVDKTETANNDTYQTIKTNRVDTKVTEINVGTSPHRIMVCTPCHSDVSMHYCQAVLKFQMACSKEGILCSFTLLKSSLVTQGRNLCVAEFLNHPDNYTHLLFIDSDIDFNYKTIFKMLDFDKDVISCPYPMKLISWDKIWRRVDTKEDAIKNEKDLATAGFTFPVKVEDRYSINVDRGLIELTHAPTGCMLIKRNVIEKMIKEYPHLEVYQPTNINGKEVKKDNMYNLFDTLHDPNTKRFYGEDFGFCQRWTDIGGKVYGYIDDPITHVGEYCYTGRFRDDLWQAARPVKSVDDTKKIK